MGRRAQATGRDSPGMESSSRALGRAPEAGLTSACAFDGYARCLRELPDSGQVALDFTDAHDAVPVRGCVVVVENQLTIGGPVADVSSDRIVVGGHALQR